MTNATLESTNHRLHFAALVQPDNIDPANGLIKGVSIMTIGEAKGHGCFIDSITLTQVMESCLRYKDGVKAKADHWSGISDTVGLITNFRIVGPKLLGDLTLLKSAKDYPLLLEMAQKMPGNFGLSICFSGYDEKIDGVIYARCDRVYSIDLVDDPAANPTGLFSESGVDTLKKGMTSKALETNPAAAPAPAVDFSPLMEQFAKLYSILEKVSASLEQIAAQNKSEAPEAGQEAGAENPTGASNPRPGVSGLDIKFDSKEVQTALEAAVKKAVAEHTVELAASAGAPPVAAAPERKQQMSAEDSKLKSALEAVNKAWGLEKTRLARQFERELGADWKTKALALTQS